MIAQTGRTSVLHAAPRCGAGNVLRAGPVRGLKAGRQLAVKVANAVKFDYDTKVFKKELVKFADTEEYIYRHVIIRFQPDYGRYSLEPWPGIQAWA
jgi:hypothetical protein